MQGRLAVAILGMVFVGCGSSSPSHPDTGAGAGLTPPITVNCADFCVRASGCLVTLCDEDTHSMQYDVFLDSLVAQCEAGCVDATFDPMVSQTNWFCLFESSCRQVFEHNACMVSPASYRCM